MDLKSIINVDSSSTVSSRPNPAPVPPARPQYVQSYPSHQHQQSSGGSVPSQQYGGRYDGRPPQPPPIRPPSHPTMGSPSGSISYHSLQSPYGTTPSSASIGGNQYPFPPSDPQSRPLSTQSNHSHYSQRTATGPPPVTQSSMHPAPSPVTPTGGGLTNTYGYPQYQHSPSSQPSYAPLPAPSHVQAYSRDGYPNMHNQNSIQRNSYPPIAQSSQPATPLGPPPSLSRASTMRREGSMSYPYDHQRTQSGSSYGHSPKSAQSSATLERNGSIPLGASPRGSISRPLPVQSQSYVSEGNRERSLSVSPKTRLMYPEPPRFMPMALGQEQQRRWSKSIDAEPGPPPFHDPYKESRPIQPTQYTTAQISPRNNARHSNGVNLIAPLNQYDLESARYTDNHGATKTQNQMPERYHEASVLQRGPSEFDRPHPPILNTQAPPILGKSPFSPSTSHDTFFDQSVARNTSRSPPAIAHAPQIITQTAVATAQTPPATAHSASASFGHSTPQTPLSSHRLATSTEISNHPSRHMPTAYQPSSRRDPSTPSTTQTPTAKSPTAQSSLTKKQEHLQHSPHPTTLDERPVKRPRVVEVPIWARKFDRGQPRKTVICDKSAIQHAQASHVTSSILPTSQQPTAKITTNSYRVAKSQQQHLLDVTSLVNRGNDPPSGLESTIANQEPFEELTREISDFLFTQIVSRPDIGSISANGTPIGPAVLEIEAKLGQLIDPDTGLRYNLPIKTESVFDCDKLGARRRPHFKSIMTEAQHRFFNEYLNNCVKESHPSAQAQLAQTKPRIPVTYKHTKQRDTFYELPARKESFLPQSVLDDMGRRDAKIRITNAKNDNTILAKIIKCRLADMDVISPHTKFDWRISVNLEIEWQGDVSELRNNAHLSANGTKGNTGLLKSREKDRMTYQHCGVYQVDLTQVTPAEATSQADKEHELEIELDAQELKKQGMLLQSGAQNRYIPLVKGFIDNVRLLARRSMVEKS